ncbi:MAG TPA: hypothetical protein VNE39_00205 [Planctomycetota bacterium]|nr:hypothetical protein [Planctomycetota bacterium]
MILCSLWEWFRECVRRPSVLISVTVGVLVSAVGLRHVHLSGAAGLNSLALAISADILIWYAWETRRLRIVAQEQAKSAQDAHTFTAITTINDALSTERGYVLRRELHAHFWLAFLAAIEKALGQECVENGSPKMSAIMELQPDHGKLQNFGQVLRDEHPGENDPLTAIESTLMALDSVALPAACGIQAAERAAKAVAPMFERTARYTLPFIAIHIRLRGQPRHREQYLRLLNQLHQNKDIDLTNEDVMWLRALLLHAKNA